MSSTTEKPSECLETAAKVQVSLLDLSRLFWQLQLKICTYKEHHLKWLNLFINQSDETEEMQQRLDSLMALAKENLEELRVKVRKN